MKELKTALERSGLEAVQTYINSGNVIFRTHARDQAELAFTIEGIIESAFRFRVPVFLRDAQAFLGIAEAVPEDWVDGKEAKCDVLFLRENIDNESILEQLPIKPGIEDARYVPGALLWRVERPLLTRSGLLKLAGTPLYQDMTVRNCNTVRKLGGLLKERMR